MVSYRQGAVGRRADDIASVGVLVVDEMKSRQFTAITIVKNPWLSDRPETTHPFHFLKMSNKAKLYYYKASGRANQIRLCLAAAGIDWEEVNPGGFPPAPEDVESWKNIGGNTTTNIPMLVMANGKVYCQSHAIIRAVGRAGGLMPKSDDGDSMYLLDKIIADAEDLRAAGYKSLTEFGAPQDAIDKYIDEILPKHLANFERQLTSNWFTGSTMTVADCTAYDAIVAFGISRVPDEIMDESKYPKLKSWIKRFEENEGIAKYHGSAVYDGLWKFARVSKK